uniref:EF-hand domain-containing protein n=1 Tax=Anopheles coluzzii TaxID=1518534 RepID=A0A8W7PK64_ANOCL
LQDEIADKAIKLTARERRFIKFASVEFDGQIYMTPQDFLESVVEQEPRPRLKRKSLTHAEIQQLKDYTPPLKHGSSQLFRSLRDKEPHSGFRIAFNMFDTDGNQRVDKDEFLVDDYVDDEQGLQRKHKVDTTLQIHFFGKKGDKDLQYDGFYNFMKNLQTEVLELEFCEFSKGHERISEVDFAKILLRYTYLDTDEYDNYLDRLLDREAKEKGVSFDEFRQFCQFLNNLDDFSIAMRMYTLADQPISKDEFSRAVKICTGSELNSHLIDTVFAIFDEDGDGLLSYKEFIAIMKDRVHRGFKVSHYEHIVEDYLDDIEKGTVYADNFRQLLKMRSRACRRLRRYLLYFYYHPDHGQSDSTRHYR